ncbi:MAG: ABC transporter ATP-binding protein [Thermoplasmatales archaeon]|nr:ABC transporter ATP-binding protein [Thermoplasmatales archaeon]MCW6169629.1 ABC transporter ATP-binding protein [Thermoplasmatales archaeon]
MSNSSEFKIAVNNLVKSYNNKTNAVDGLTFSVSKGEIYGLLGRNGAGKTTTIRILTTLIPPTSGNAEVCGMDVVHKATKIRKLIGVVQQGEAFDFTTVEGNFKIYQLLWEIPKEEASNRMEYLMDLFKIGHLRKKRMFELSGGEKKRVQVAREFMHDMEVLFLDEPTVGMDPIMRRDVLNFVRNKAKEGLTVLFTTQILEEADYLCDRIGIMNNGIISAEGTSVSLKNSYGDLRKVEMKFSLEVGSDLIERLKREFSKISDIQAYSISEKESEFIIKNMGKTLPLILSLFGSIGVSIETISTNNPTLDDVFLQVVAR